MVFVGVGVYPVFFCGVGVDVYRPCRGAAVVLYGFAGVRNVGGLYGVILRDVGDTG